MVPWLRELFLSFKVFHYLPVRVQRHYNIQDRYVVASPSSSLIRLEILNTTLSFHFREGPLTLGHMGADPSAP